MEGALLLDIVVGQSAAVLQLFSGEDEALLVLRNAFFFFNLALHIFHRIRTLYFQCHGFSGKGFHKDLHLAWDSFFHTQYNNKLHISIFFL